MGSKVKPTYLLSDYLGGSCGWQSKGPSDTEHFRVLQREGQNLESATAAN